MVLQGAGVFAIASVSADGTLVVVPFVAVALVVGKLGVFLFLEDTGFGFLSINPTASDNAFVFVVAAAVDVANMALLASTLVTVSCRVDKGFRAPVFSLVAPSTDDTCFAIFVVCIMALVAGTSGIFLLLADENFVGVAATGSPIVAVADLGDIFVVCIMALVAGTSGIFLLLADENFVGVAATGSPIVAVADLGDIFVVCIMALVAGTSGIFLLLADENFVGVAATGSPIVAVADLGDIFVVCIMALVAGTSGIFLLLADENFVGVAATGSPIVAVADLGDMALVAAMSDFCCCCFAFGVVVVVSAATFSVGTALVSFFLPLTVVGIMVALSIVTLFWLAAVVFSASHLMPSTSDAVEEASLAFLALITLAASLSPVSELFLADLIELPSLVAEATAFGFGVHSSGETGFTHFSFASHSNLPSVITFSSLGCSSCLKTNTSRSDPGCSWISFKIVSKSFCIFSTVVFPTFFNKFSLESG